MVTNLAVISGDDLRLIRFVDQSGDVFDRLLVGSHEDPEAALVKNGFMTVKEGDDFSKL